VKCEKRVETNKGQINECDYDNNCTRLYSLLQKSEWDFALLRIGTFPSESQTWVKRLENGKLRWRMLPIHAAIIYKAPQNVVSALIEAYGDGLKSQDDQGKLPLHLLVRQKNFDDGIFDLLVNNYPKAVFVKDKRGRSPKEMTDLGKSVGGKKVVGDEERNPDTTTQNSRDQKVAVLQTNFTSGILEYAKKGNAESAALVRLETEEFTHSLVELIDHFYTNELMESKVANQRYSKLNNSLGKKVEDLKKEIEASNKKYELYKTILQGNNAMLARCNQVIASMSETQDKTYAFLSDHRHECEAASKSRISLINDLISVERRDQSASITSVEKIEKFIDSAKVKINNIETVENGFVANLSPNIASGVGLDCGNKATEVRD